MGNELTMNEQLNTLKRARLLIEHLAPEVSIYMWGPPGVGKTTMVREVCEEKGWQLVELHLSRHEAVDLRGFPTLSEDRTTARFVPFEDILPVPGKCAERGVLFLDELNLATLDVQKAVYQLCLERRVGSYKLPEGWKVVAASNRPEDNPMVVERLQPPLANRFIHVVIEPPMSAEARLDFYSWLMRHGVHPSVISYLKWRPDAIFNQMDAEVDLAFPTPRSWHKLSIALNSPGLEIMDGRGLIRHDKLDMVRYLAAGCVGQREGALFCEFVDLCWTNRARIEMPNAEEILTVGPEEAGVQKALAACTGEKRIALQYAIGTAVNAALLTNRSYWDKRGIANYSSFLSTLEPEIQALCAREALAHQELREVLIKSKEFGQQVSKKLLQILTPTLTP
ncbi:MAG: AAA family ATPase [Thermofilaceae archaeon]